MKRFILILALLVPSAAFAQVEGGAAPKSDRCGDDKSGKGSYEKIVRPDGSVVYKMKKAFCLVGTVPKPSVLYGLLNTTINYEWENLKQDFLPRVIHSVESSPF